MAIPAMITSFGTQQANYGAAVGQSLAQLGQRIGERLAMQQYQKDAAAALPAMQAAYKSAFDKMGQGQYADGYMELLNTNLQFGATQNPFIAQFAEQANQTAKQMESALWRQAQYGERTGGTETTSGMPGVDVSRYGFTRTAAPATQGGQPKGQPKATLLPPGATVEAELPVEGDYTTDTGDATALSGTPQQNEAARNVKELFSLPPEQQANAVATYGTSQYDPNQFDVEKIPGLNKYLPGFEAFLVPKKEWIENKARLGPGGFTSESALVEGENRENFYKQDGTKTNLNKAVGVMQDKKMSDLFKAFNNDIFAMRSAATQDVQDGETVYTIVPPSAKEGAEPTRITLPQYEAISTIAGIAASTAQNAGGTPALFKEPPAAAPAPAAGGAKPSLLEIRDGTTAPAEGAATPAAATPAPTTQPVELTLEERIAAKTKPAAMPAKAATREQLSRVQKSKLSSEKTRLERIIYETTRVGGKKLKRGLTQQDPDVKEVLAKITEINKQLEGL